MLRELVDLASRLESDGELPPVAYRKMSRNSPIRWVVHIDPGTGEAELEETSISVHPRPVRQRSGKPSVENLKPYLLVDDARYALGTVEPGHEDQALLLRRGFRDVVREAAEETRDPELLTIVGFLEDEGRVDALASRVRPRDVVTFTAGQPPYPYERAPVQGFWARYVEREFTATGEGTCCACGVACRPLQMLPVEVVVLGQTCKVTSFNQTAFTSLGKSQTTNAPLCFRCAERAAQTLNYLLGSPSHSSVLARDDRKGRGRNPLRNLVAVYWVEGGLPAEAGDPWDLEAALAEPLQPPPATGPAPHLTQVEALLKLPWAPREASLGLAVDAFHLAVLSANKARLVVREWLAVPLEAVRHSLAWYLAAAKLTDARGIESRALSIPALLVAVRTSDPNLMRGLVRTAYLGVPPPPGMLGAALRRVRLPQERAQEGRIQALMAVVKLALTHPATGCREEEAARMERLDPDRNKSAYLCGRLLAVLGEAQQRASASRLNSTLVDRFYGAASTAPGVHLPILVRMAQTAHLPKVRRLQHRHAELRDLLTSIMTAIDEAGGFPGTLDLRDQGEFALGYYHQQADLAAARQAALAAASSPKKGDTP